MARISKKLAEARKQVDNSRIYTLEEALDLAKKTSYTKFDGSIDLALNLNLDVRQADQQLRGSITLPNGTGRSVRVLAVTDDLAQQKAAKEAKAEIVVNSADLVQLLNAGKLDFDIIITDPKVMPALGKFGKLLGPRGLMPNPKTGTVTVQVAKAVEEVKKGKANYRTDKNGIIHTTIGKASMKTPKLVENANTVIETIRRLKPAAVKGAYFKNLTVSASMGPSIKIEIKQ